jgi:hypothetical protein
MTIAIYTLSGVAPLHHWYPDLFKPRTAYLGTDTKSRTARCSAVAQRDRACIKGDVLKRSQEQEGNTVEVRDA